MKLARIVDKDGKPLTQWTFVTDEKIKSMLRAGIKIQVQKETETKNGTN